MANIEHEIAITANTCFRAGSLAKQFTAYAVLILVERGVLTLDDDVRKYVAGLPAYESPPKIRDLLHHTSGIRDYLALMSLAGLGDGISEEQALHLIGRSKRLNFTPGSEFLYSNSGYFLLSLVVRQVTGLTLREFTHENIFKPLAMTSSQFIDDHSTIIPNRASGYTPNGEGGHKLLETRLNTVGDGGLFTTIADLARWDENFYRNTKVNSGHSLLDSFVTPGRLANGETLRYACGLFVGRFADTLMIHHPGAFAGFRAQFIRLPKLHLSIACLCNSTDLNPTRLALAVAEICIGDAHRHAGSRRLTARGSVPIHSWQGCYRDPVSRTVWFVSLIDGELELDIGDARLKMVAKTAFLFVVDDPIANFPYLVEFETIDVQSTTMRITSDTSNPTLLERLEVQQLSDIVGYEGAYYCGELDSVVRIVNKEGTLRLTPPLPGVALRPVSANLFQAGPATLEFDHSNMGTLTGFRLYARRVRGLTYSRLPRYEPSSGCLRGGTQAEFKWTVNQHNERRTI